MAFCQKCGAQLAPEVKFCSKCGSPVSNVSQAAPAVSEAPKPSCPKAPKKPFNFKLLIIIVVALIVIAGGIVAAVQINSHIKEKKEEEEKKAEKLARTFSFEESIDFTFNGYDTAGSLSYVINEDVIDTIKEKAKIDDPESLINSIYVSANPSIYSYDLSNGDEIEVEVSYDEDLAKKAKIYFTDEEFTITVKGLEDFEEVDPFEYIEWTQDGMDGRIYITANWKEGAPEWIDDTYFTINDNYYLSQNDEFTIKVYSYSSLFEDYGIKFTTTTKTYTVGAADKYLESVDELSDITLADMQQEAIELIESDYDSDYDRSASDLEYVGAYSYSSWGSTYVNLIFKGKVTYTDSWYNDDGTYDAYYTASFNSIIIKADKTQTYEIGYSSQLYTSEDDLIEDIEYRSDSDDFSIIGEFADSFK